jgi:cell division protein ZapA
MNKKNDAQVIINGKNYNIAGYENVEYLHKIADYINNKQAALKGVNGNNIINDSERNILIMINIADDYLKLKALEEENSANFVDHKKEVENLQNTISEYRNKLEETEKENRLLRKDNLELQRKVIRFETEMKDI